MRELPPGAAPAEEVAGLSVSYSSASPQQLLGDDRLLFLVEFAPRAISSEPRHVIVELDPLGAPLNELWHAVTPVERGSADALAYSRTDDFMFAQLSTAAVDDAHLASATRNAYLRLLSWVRDAGFAHLLRMWNYVSGINTGAGDAERYRQFCLGRAEALETLGYLDSSLPAATGVGTRRGANDLSIYLLAATQPGVAIENPRQISAYRYPRTYGPKSPSFSRAIRLGDSSTDSMLFVSGTASIVGHESMHDGSITNQLRETLRNLDALLAVSAQGCPPGLCHLPPTAIVKAYVRDRDHAELVRQAFAPWVPARQMLLLLADICRADLLVEVEVIVPRGARTFTALDLRRHA